MSIPRRVRGVFRLSRRALAIAQSTLGRRRRYCPVCGRWARYFISYGRPARPDAQCPFCGSLERQRLLWLYLHGHSDDLRNGAGPLLHVAPAPCLESRLKKSLGVRYLTADLFDPRAMVKLDVTNIERPDGHFAAIICSHVLEHVDDDRRAMAEFFRTLRPGGTAILMVPITAPRTFEDPAIVSPGERLRAFGQEDHVRRYGPDFVDRLRESGFAVAVVSTMDLASSADGLTMGLTSAAGEIYACTKPASDRS